MSLNEFWKELWQNQRALIAAGFGFLALLIVLAIVSLFDSQQILGINRWVKPMKFAISIAIFLFTLAVYLNFLRGYERASRIIAVGTIGMLVGEIILIVMQAARGTTSHFNVKTVFDNIIFSSMGLMILINTLLIVHLTYLYFRSDFNLPEAVVWGMRSGLVVFLLASLEGGYMSTQLAHSVGTTDGGAGLPFVNWSTEGGDLRVAHFVGMHALQAIPLFAVMLVWLQKRFAPIHSTALTIVFAVLYFAAVTFVFVQAVLGKPLLGKQIIVIQIQP
jgi:hypothetical protein